MYIYVYICRRTTLDFQTKPFLGPKPWTNAWWADHWSALLLQSFCQVLQPARHVSFPPIERLKMEDLNHLNPNFGCFDAWNDNIKSMDSGVWYFRTKPWRPSQTCSCGWTHHFVLKQWIRMQAIDSTNFCRPKCGVWKWWNRQCVNTKGIWRRPHWTWPMPCGYTHLLARHYATCSGETIPAWWDLENVEQFSTTPRLNFHISMEKMVV